MADPLPVSLVFQVEAFLFVGFFAWLIARFGFEKPGGLAFVVLSSVGSLAFSVAAFLLMHLRKQERRIGSEDVVG